MDKEKHLRITVTDDDGVVYDVFDVEQNHERLGWLVADSTGDRLTVDEVLTAATRWLAEES